MDEGYLTPDGYLPRIVDARIEKLLRSFGGVEITGAKWWDFLSYCPGYKPFLFRTVRDAYTASVERELNIFINRLRDARKHFIDYMPGEKHGARS